MNTHVLKCWPEPFADVLRGAKLHEIRKADRNFDHGDNLQLCEWDPASEGYTGRVLVVSVTYLTHGGEWGLPLGMCVMSVRLSAVQHALRCQARLVWGDGECVCPSRATEAGR